MVRVGRRGGGMRRHGGFGGRRGFGGFGGGRRHGGFGGGRRHRGFGSYGYGYPYSYGYGYPYSSGYGYPYGSYYDNPIGQPIIEQQAPKPEPLEEPKDDNNMLLLYIILGIFALLFLIMALVYIFKK